MSPALVGSSYPLCYQGDPNLLSYCVCLLFFLIYRGSTAWIHFPMYFGWHKGILNISFFLSSLFTGILCLPSNCWWFFIDTTLFLPVFFLEGAPHLTGPLWLDASCHCASQLNCSHLRKPQFSQSGLGTLFFFSLPWAHLHHYSWYHVMMQLWICVCHLPLTLASLWLWTRPIYLWVRPRFSSNKD